MTPQILAAMIVDRTAFEVIFPNVSTKTLDPISSLILSGIARYYNLDSNAEYIDISVLGDQIVAGLSNPKHAPEIKQLLTVVSDVAPTISSKNVKEVFRIYKEHDLSRQIAAACAGSDRTGAQDLMEEYLRLNDTAGDVEREPELVDLITQRFNKEGLMPILPLALNEALDGGARKEHHILCMGRPECYAEGTDVLTSEGWLPFSALTKEHRVAQYDADGNISYCHPDRIVSYPVNDETLVRVTSKKGQVDLLVTKDHDLVYRQGGAVKKVKASQAAFYHKKCHILAGTTSTAGGDMSPHERLLVAFQADGSFGNPLCTGARSGHLSYRFSLSKVRKLGRLGRIADACNYASSWYKLSGGKTEVHVHVPPQFVMSKDFSWVQPSTRSAAWLAQFIEELSWWDATRRSRTRFKFDTTNRGVADVVQEACALVGYACFASTFVDDRKESYKDIHSLSIRTDCATVNGQAITTKEEVYSGNVYCCTVPTGMLLVRYRGKVCVSGNSGKSLYTINMGAGLARFGAKGIFFENEDRTDDTRLRLWCNLSGMSRDQIRENSRLAQEKARANGIQNIRVQALSPGTPGEIKYFVKTEKPDFIIVNQIRNLHVRAGTRTEQLERAATEMRNIGKKHGVLVASVTQAGDSATDKLILDQGDCDGSNTGIPAQMDVILGVGLNMQYDQQDMRHLSLSKNKLGGRRWDKSFKIDRGTSRILESTSS